MFLAIHYRPGRGGTTGKCEPISYYVASVSFITCGILAIYMNFIAVGLVLITIGVFIGGMCWRDMSGKRVDLLRTPDNCRDLETPVTQSTYVFPQKDVAVDLMA